MKLPPLIYNSIGKFLVFAALEAVCLILIARNSTVQSSRVMEGVRTVYSFFWEKTTAVKNYTALRHANRNLMEENAWLLEQNAKFREYIVRLQGEDRLAELSAQMSGNVGDSALAGYSFTLAKVIKNTLGTTHNYLIIDKGTKDGVTEDLGVITPSGVVGIIRASGPRFSYVMSLLNLRQSISVKLGRGSALGTLKWEGGSIRKACLTEVALNAEVNKGDTVFTSGNSSFFPPDIPVGKALSYTIEDGMYKRVEVELLQDFSSLDHVIVIKNSNKREIDSLSAINAAYIEKK